MTSSIKDKTVTILIVESVSGVRPIMTECMRELGFKNIMSIDSLAAAMSILETEHIGWLITSVFPDGDVNVLQILKIASQAPHLQKMKVSVFATEEEQGLLLKAFLLGLFTCHEKPFNKDSFLSQMTAVLQSLDRNNWAATLVAAEYLRPRVRKERPPQTLLQFEQKLNQLFPEHTEGLLTLAEAHYLAGNATDARSLLWQATQRRPELANQVEETLTSLASNGPKESADSKLFELGSCVIVEPDSVVSNAVKDVMVLCGAKEIQVFDNGEVCWEWLKTNGAPELLVMEWRVPALSGPLLIQRCRAEGFHLLSIIVQSSLVQKADEPLLKEMGVTEILPKPFQKSQFLNCVAATLTQSQFPSEARTLEQKIRASLAAGKLSDAANLMQVYLKKISSLKTAELGRSQLEAEFAFAAGNFSVAKEMALKSMRLGNKSVTLLNLLGKVLMELRDFTAALQVFKKADHVAPNSIERLCAIAETQQELGDTAAAKEALDSAIFLDPDNQCVVNTSVNIGLASGDNDMVRSALDKFRPADSILAYVNNKAIAHSRSGDFDEAIKIYTNAINSLPKDKESLKTTIGYNLALAYARKNDVPAVIAALESIPETADALLKKKKLSLMTKARAALANKTPLQLAGAESTELRESKNDQSVTKVVTGFGFKEAKEIACCFEVFADTVPDSDLIKTWLATLPRFQPRQAVVKS